MRQAWAKVTMHRNVLAALILLHYVAPFSRVAVATPVTIAEIVINITQGTQASPLASASLQLECAPCPHPEIGHDTRQWPDSSDATSSPMQEERRGMLTLGFCAVWARIRAPRSSTGSWEASSLKWAGARPQTLPPLPKNCSPALVSGLVHDLVCHTQVLDWGELVLVLGLVHVSDGSYNHNGLWVAV